jgi:hypothetical protein
MTANDQELSHRRPAEIRSKLLTAPTPVGSSDVLGHDFMVCLTPQTSRSSVPKICKRELVNHEKGNATGQIKECHLPNCDGNKMPKDKPDEKNQTSHTAKDRASLKKHTIVNVSILRWPHRNDRPPTSLHVGEPVHKIFDLSHSV